MDPLAFLMGIKYVVFEPNCNTDSLFFDDFPGLDPGGGTPASESQTIMLIWLS